MFESHPVFRPGRPFRDLGPRARVGPPSAPRGGSSLAFPPYVKCEGPVPPGPVFTGPAGSTCPTGNFLSACPVPSTPALSSPVPRQDRVTNLRVTYREKNCDPTPRETTYVSLTFTVQFSAASACRPGARTASDTRNVDRSRETDSCSLPRPIHARGDRVSMRMETTRRLF
jgi:hypothetical protein